MDKVRFEKGGTVVHMRKKPNIQWLSTLWQFDKEAPGRVTR